MKAKTAIGISALLFSTSCYASSFSKASQKETPSHITIRADAGQKYSLTYEEGIKKIANLAATEFKEDEWLFDGSNWHDIGLENVNPIDNSIDYNHKLYEEIVKTASADTVYSIHIHPFKLVERDNILHYGLNGPSKVGYCPPSLKDLYTTKRQQQIGKKYNKTIISQVVDAEGVWSYYCQNYDALMKEYDIVIDEILREDIDSQDKYQKYLHLQTLARDWWKPSSDNSFTMQWKSREEYNFNSQYRGLREAASNLGFQLSFQPHK